MINRESISRKLNHISKRAREKNISFDLTVDWYVQKLQQGVCEVTGLPFYTGTYDHTKGIHPFIPSIDKTVPEEGYTKGNCKLVIMVYNQAKAEGTKEDLIIWAKEFIKRYENEVMLEQSRKS